MTTDADLNAAVNHETELFELPWWVCYDHINRISGFYWLGDGIYDSSYELIVRNVQETIKS